MAVTNIQDRTNEFLAIVHSKLRPLRVSQQQSPVYQDNHSTPKQRSVFSRKASEVSKSISQTSAKLLRLAELARRQSLFDDRSIEINELTFVIKQDLAALDRSIKDPQNLYQSLLPKHRNQEAEHARNVVLFLRQNLGHFTTQFKDTLELRTKTIQAMRSRQENFLFSVSASSSKPLTNRLTTIQPQQPADRKSPLYQNANTANVEL